MTTKLPKNSFIEMIHFKKIKHVKNLTSYLVEFILKDSRIIDYTGDNCDKNLIKQIFKEDKFSELYIDCSTNLREKHTHFMLSDIVKCSKKEQRKKVICMHIMDKQDVKECIIKGFNVALEKK